MLHPYHVLLVFYGDAHPDVGGRQTIAVPAAKITSHQGTALGQYLKGMPVGGFHRVEHGIEKRIGHLFMEEVAHRVYKNALGVPPIEGLFQPLGPEREVKAVRKRMTRDAAESF